MLQTFADEILKPLKGIHPAANLFLFHTNTIFQFKTKLEQKFVQNVTNKR